MSYISHTDAERAEMLKEIGAGGEGMETLFSCIPRDLRSGPLDLPDGRSEYEVIRHIRGIARKNTSDLISFLGGGFYDHYIPAAVDALASRSEFYTAYTPYQPEASQGGLQAIYEYQSCIARLTGMEVSNASLYDGGTALYEAVMMAVRITRRRKVIMDGAVSPIYRKMIRSYTGNLSIEFVETPIFQGGRERYREEIERFLDEDTAAVILQNPNFFGTVDDHSDIAVKCRDRGILVIQSVYPVALGILKTPGEMGADIVTGEGQSLGIPLSFGGPYLGFMATRRKYVRKMPGRVVGATRDSRGRRGYVLTLQTREQHIRREKATSNICSNEALCALRALIYMCLVGKEGLKEIAQLCMDKAEFAKQKLSQIKGVEVKSWPTFNEFIVTLPKSTSDVMAELISRGIEAGFPLSRYYSGMENYMLIAVTEKRTKQEIVSFANALEDALWN